MLKLIYPGSSSCILCGDEYEESSYVCCSCKGKLNRCDIKSVLEKNGVAIEYYSAAYYSSSIKELILRLKYRSDFEAGELFVELLKEIIIAKKIEFDIITFVPSSEKSIKKRGYNQSEYLARALGKSLDRTVKNLLIKTKETLDQIGLDSESRWKNLKDCFDVIHKKYIQDKCIILVDDVITTGATVFSCSRVLLENGCNKVIVLTVAKSKI